MNEQNPKPNSLSDVESDQTILILLAIQQESLHKLQQQVEDIKLKKPQKL